MSDCLPRSCHELNKHLLAEDSDSGVEAIVHNCKMKAYGSSSHLGALNPASCCSSVLWLRTENSRAQQWCPSSMDFVQLRDCGAESCSSGWGQEGLGEEVLRKLNVTLKRQDFFCVFTVLIQWFPQTSDKYCDYVWKILEKEPWHWH